MTSSIAIAHTAGRSLVGLSLIEMPPYFGACLLLCPAPA
jgi:hypothetical protein